MAYGQTYSGQKWDANKIILVCVAGIGVMFWQKIYDAFFKKTSGEQIRENEGKAEVQQSSTSLAALQQGTKESWLTPNYWRRFNGAKIFTVAATAQMVATLYHAMSGFGTDESAIYSVFQSCKAKSQASWLADAYAKTYNSSLLADLSDEMDTNELSKIYLILSRLPDA